MNDYIQRFNDREVVPDKQDSIFMSSCHDERPNVLARKSISADIKMDADGCSPKCSCNTQCTCVSKSVW